MRGRFRIRNLKYVKECEPQQRQGFAQAPHLWKPHFRDSRNSAVSAVQYESGFRESNMPYQHCRGSDSHWSLSKTIVCERDHRANRLPYFKFRILKRPQKKPPGGRFTFWLCIRGHQEADPAAFQRAYRRSKTQPSSYRQIKFQY